MTPLKADAIPALDSWGTVADIGSEILDGECAASGKMIHGAPTDAVSCGFFAVTKGKFRMTYPFTEHAVVLEGSLTLTDEGTGVSTTYTAGEGWFVEKGAVILWDVHSDRFVKNYLAVV
ncbi:protein of unknown function DUF861 cupin_3 [Sphingobium chlorophenolicum L-1]|uniref:(S)-ureidoglycine aminohydrolase cupin domain-containing protein n=1 Tax=Sphingobium chlorophenolicum L-1 TaxID=690566 RepID=F6EWX0_SPHCR|nr:cupin domain-containing protein [Sphingobium chlorophenolicum]AEG48133.1 protein of unknown function DUF861 cupin_3 [Sphingobium chlorophenolicum L-1]